MKNKIRSMIKKLRHFAARFKNSICYHYYYKTPLDPSAALFTSRNGGELSGNMLRLAVKLHEQSGGTIRIIIAARKQKKTGIEQLISQYIPSGAEVVIYDSLKYLKYLESARYLFCDATLPLRWVKKEGQIYMNTWHGTPLKMMGNDSRSDRYDVANVQKNFMAADYLVFPNEYCREKMLGAYGITDLYQGEVLMNGYPENDVFYDEDLREQTRHRYDLQDRKVYVYMPTFREVQGTKQISEQLRFARDFLAYMDSHLAEEEVLYVKFHVFVAGGLTFSRYEHIRPFPSDVDTYEFLNAADCLISDYSSVMYDFANTRRSIVRFVYDETAYLRNRGYYEQPVEMPFPKAAAMEELLSVIRNTITYDDEAFYMEFCRHEEGLAAQKAICRLLETESVPQPAAAGSRTPAEPSCLIYNEAIRPGHLTQQQSMMIDPAGQTEYLAFSKQHLQKSPDNYRNIPAQIRAAIGISLDDHRTAGEDLARRIMFRHCRRHGPARRRLDRLYAREAHRLFAGYPFERYIYYLGRDLDMAAIFTFLSGRSCIYLHYSFFNVANKNVLAYCLNCYDEVLVPDEEMVQKAAAYVTDQSKIRRI